MSRIYRTLGTVAMTPKGEYDSSAYYEKLNIVTYNGSSYVALQNTHDNLPTNTTYWQLLAQKGAKTYNNVAEMEADTDLKDGMVAETLGYYSANDGGGATYKITSTESQIEYQEELESGLYATLIVEGKKINILSCGAKKDKSQDIGVLVNKLLNDLDFVVYVPKGEYLVTTTIEPSGRKELIIDGNLTYTGNNSCIKISTQFNKISTQKITSSGICVLFENNNSLALCQNNKVELNDIVESTTTHALVFHSINQGVTYNNIEFTTLRAESSSYCIYLKTESTGTYARYVAETTIKGGQCTRGLYAIYIDTNTTGGTGEVTGIHFETISCEGVTNGIYISNARGNNFDYIRVGELSGHYLKLKDSAKNNIFNILSTITHDKIDVSEMSTNDNHINIINGKYAASGGSLLANKIILTKQRIYLQELINRSYKNITSTPYTLTNDETRFYILITQNESTINLNEYYGVNGINEFWVESSRTFSLYDKDNNLICSNTAGPTIYLFHCVCYSKNGVDTWIVDKKEK